MALVLTGTGGLFTRLGHLIASLNAANAVRATTLPARAALIAGDYASSDQALASGVYAQLLSSQNSLAGFNSYLRRLAQQTVIQQVNEAISLPDQSLRTALNALIASMVATADTVNRPTVSAAVTPGGGNAGTGVVRATMAEPAGVPADYAFAESVTGAVTRDAQNDGANAGQESLRFQGGFAVTDPLSWLYPAGSGASATLKAISASAYNGSGKGNQLSNGDFELWTVANVPDGWHIAIGTAGTTVLQSTAQHYDGSSSLNVLGNGSELTQVYTALGVDTSAAPSALDQLAVNLWVKVDSAPAAGVLRVALVDGSASVINDAAGTPNAFNVALTTVGTAFVPVGGFFRLPRVLPASVRLQLKLTTALTSGRNVYVDRLALAEPVALYPGGPKLAAFSGAVPWVDGDAFAVAVANNLGGLLAYGCDRLLGLRSQGLLLPSSATPTVGDSLVV